MNIKNITYKIRGCAYNVYKELGPGCLENVYEEALTYELLQAGFDVKRQLEVPIIYRGQQLATPLRLDIIVNDTVIVELKAVQELLPVHYKQLYSYLRLANKTVGILINFYVPNIFDGMKTVYAQEPHWVNN